MNVLDTTHSENLPVKDTPPPFVFIPIGAPLHKGDPRERVSDTMRSDPIGTL